MSLSNQISEADHALLNHINQALLNVDPNPHDPTSNKVNEILNKTKLKRWVIISINSNVILTSRQIIEGEIRQISYSPKKNEKFFIKRIEGSDVILISNLKPKLLLSVSHDSLVWNFTPVD